MATFVCLFMMKYATMIHSDDRPNFYELGHQWKFFRGDEFL